MPAELDGHSGLSETMSAGAAGALSLGPRKKP